MFDNVAGGQSMVIDLHIRRAEWFDKAIEQLKLPESPDHDKLCLTSYIRCLITRDQSLTAFDRKAALAAFKVISLGGNMGLGPDEDTGKPPSAPAAPKKPRK